MNDVLSRTAAHRPRVGIWVVVLSCSVAALVGVFLSLVWSGCVPIGSPRNQLVDLMPWVVLGFAAAAAVADIYVIVAVPRGRRLAVAGLVVVLVAVAAMFVGADQRLRLC